MKPIPLRLFLLAHPQSESAGLLGQELMRRFVDPPASGGLRVPVFFTPDCGDGLPPAWDGPDGIQLDASRHTLVVVLADARMALRTSFKPSEKATGAAWQQFLEDGAQRAPVGVSPHHVFGVAIAKARNEQESADANVFALGQARHVLGVTKEPVPRQEGESDEAYSQRFNAWLMTAADEIALHISIRAIRLLAEEKVPEDVSVDQKAPVRLFLSHAKADLKSDESDVVRKVEDALKELPIEAWFDAAKIRPGASFESEIAAGLQDCTILVSFLTDNYASRPWCQREILDAKKLGAPILMVDALQHGESRNFPYLGNLPTMRWHADDPQSAAKRIVGRAVREALRFMHNRAVVERSKKKETVVASAPEALTLAWQVKSNKQIQFLYPDPPLAKAELDVLHQLRPKAVFKTPLSKLAEWKKPAGLNCIAVSTSVSSDKRRFGLTKQHEESLFDELHGYLLMAGLQIGYGGALSANFQSATNFTLRLFELVRSYSTLAANAGTSPLRPVVNFAPWPLRMSYGQSEAELFSNARTAELKLGAEPPESEIPRLDEQGQPLFPDGVNVFSLPDTPLRQLAWTRGLTLMRQQMTRETQARLVIGGTLSGFRGLYPGVVEEAWSSIMVNLAHANDVSSSTSVQNSTAHPLYLAGAFGGAARAVIDLLEGRDRVDVRQPELGKTAPSVDSILELAKSRGLTVITSESSVDAASLNLTTSLVTPDRIATNILSAGRLGLTTALSNGLTDAENQELFRTPDPPRIAELILTGLSKVRPAL